MVSPVRNVFGLLARAQARTGGSGMAVHGRMDEVDREVSSARGLSLVAHQVP